MSLFGIAIFPPFNFSGNPGPTGTVPGGECFGLALFPPFNFSGSIAPATPILFGNELANFIRARLGINAYPSKLPQQKTSYPLLSYTIIDGDSDLIATGPSGFAYRGVQFDAWSTKSPEVETIAEQLRLLLAGYRGPMGRLFIKNCNRHPSRTFSTPSASGLDSGSVYRFMSEYKFWFIESRN